MDNTANATAPSSVPPDPLPSESYPNPDQYADDELLLLQLADINNDPLLPRLEDAVDETNAPSSHAPDKKAASPLLMERPQSSGVDVTAFRFSKPFQRGTSFSSRSSKEQQSGASAPQGCKTSQGNQITTRESGYRNTAAGDSSRVQTRSERQSSPVLQSNLCPERHSPPVAEQQGQSQEEGPEIREECSLRPRPNETQVDPENGRSVHNPTVREYSRSSRSGDKQTHLDFITQSTSSDKAAPKDSSVSSPSAPKDSSFRVTKRRGVNSRKVGHKPTAEGTSVNSSSHLTEDDLFQLLIGRLKQREESDLAASNLRVKLLADISGLKTENESLKDHIQACSSQLQKRTSESRRYKAHMDNWKAKLGKFKGILNGLGADYQALRGESNDLKAAGLSVEGERKSLKASIDDIKAQVLQVSNKVCEGRSHLSETREIVSSLQNSVRNSEVKAEFARIRLVDEKQRTAVLESYIQNHTNLQGKQIGFLRNGQHEMMNKMSAGFELIDKQSERSQSNIQSILKPMLDEFSTSMKSLGDEYSVGKIDIQQSKDTVQELMSQMNSMACQWADDTERNSELKAQLAKDHKERAEMIANAVGPDSALFKQLVAGQETGGCLNISLDSLGSNLSNLTGSMGKLDEKEEGLARQLEEAIRSFAEVRVPEQVPLESETREQLANNQLQLQLDEVSAQLNMAQANMETKELENESTRNALSEATAQTRVAEERATQLESEVVALQKNVKAVELKVREELSRASVVSRDHIRAKFEQQLQSAFREKTEREKELERIMKQLGCVQQSMAEMEAASQGRKKEIESLLAAKDEQIQSLQASQVDSGARMAARDGEIEKYKDLEVSKLELQKLLEERLEEANERIANQEQEMSAKEETNCDTLRELQARFESLQASFRKKDEECSSMQNELSAANSAMWSLQSGKDKARAEIHSLLRRVQDSERWMKVIKETLGNFGINTADEAFPETWTRLEALLQATHRTSTPTTIPCGSPQTVLSIKRDSPTRNTLTPRKSAGNPSEEVFQTTELIYRTQSIQRGTSSPPGSQRGDRPGISGGGLNSIPDSQTTTNIVPFSSILNQNSPAHSYFQDEDPNELAKLLISSPENKGMSTEPFALDENSRPGQASKKAHATEKSSANPEKSQAQTESVTGEYTDINCSAKRKAVTFERGTSTVNERNEVPESPYNKSQNAPGGFTNERVPSRLNQRTYGKSQTYASTKGGRKLSFREEPLGENGANSNILPESPRATEDKRIKVSGHSSRPERKTRRASQYLETRASPTGLASGSSRRSPWNDQQPGKKLAGRGQRRGRKTRGDRYSARFIHET